MNKLPSTQIINRLIKSGLTLDEATTLLVQFIFEQRLYEKRIKRNERIT